MDSFCITELTEVENLRNLYIKNEERLYFQIHLSLYIRVHTEDKHYECEECKENVHQ